MNIGLFMNDKIAEVARRVLEDATLLQNLIPELEGQPPNMNRGTYRNHLNPRLISFRRGFNELINLTKAQIRKTAPSPSNLAVITESRKLCLTSINAIPVKMFTGLAFQYFDILVSTDILPITAGYKEESGVSRLMRE